MVRHTSSLRIYGLLEAVAATPTFSPSPGTYSSTQTVSLSDTSSGATIYYTTDGSPPTTSSTIYNGSITVSATEILKAIASGGGFTTSSITIGTYTISTSSGGGGGISYT